MLIYTLAELILQEWFIWKVGWGEYATLNNADGAYDILTEENIFDILINYFICMWKTTNFIF